MLDKIQEMKRYINANQEEWEKATAKSPTEVIKLSIGGTELTASELQGWKDCIPLVDKSLKIFREPPSANVSAGIQGGGDILLQPVGFIIHGNAKVGALTAAVMTGGIVDFEFARLQTTDGKTVGATGYESKECPVLTNVMRYNSFKFFILLMQNIKYKEYTFDEKGVRKAVGSAGDFDASKNQSKL